MKKEEYLIKKITELKKQGASITEIMLFVEFANATYQEREAN